MGFVPCVPMHKGRGQHALSVVRVDLVLSEWKEFGVFLGCCQGRKSLVVCIVDVLDA